MYGKEKTEGTKKIIDNPIRYAKQYFDEESGMYYLRARYYDPDIMRFISEDTYRGDIKNPLSLNYYTYCQGNPISYVDPSGNVPVETVFDIISIGLSVGDFLKDPSLVNAGFVLWDIGSALLPYVPGSYVKKGMTTAGKVDDLVDGYKGYKVSKGARKGTIKMNLQLFGKGTSEGIEWTNHGYKHFPQKNLTWKKVIKSTKNGPAKYMPDINIEQLERKVWEKGTSVTNGKTWKVMEFDDVIGATVGKETRYMRVEMSAGTIHGHPITKAEYLKLLK